MARPTILLGEPHFSAAAREVLAGCGDVLEFGSHDEFVRRLPEADAVVVGLDVALRKPLLDRAARLRVIATRTSGLDHIDVDEARRRGIEILHHEPDAEPIRRTTSTAEAAFALLLALVRNVPWAFQSVKEGRWERHRYAGRELQGKTLGIVGFGRLGQKVAAYGRAFEMVVLAHDPRRSDVEAAGFEAASLADLLRRSDVVSLHASRAHGDPPLLGEAELGLMKPSALLLNTARGELVDERALLVALTERRIAGAALDTLAGEEPDGSHLAGNPLVEYAATHENLLLLPHLGGATAEAAERTQLYISERLAEHLRRIGSA